MGESLQVVDVGGDVAEHGEVVCVVDYTADVVHLVAVQYLLPLEGIVLYTV